MKSTQLIPWMTILLLAGLGGFRKETDPYWYALIVLFKGPFLGTH